ncbi:hypothetical protein CcaverHIS631_0606070 [Cutaneotrichosporon cavernicola]|nr:hypothetical protein CcaverHIS631_0606070 [Cutaneotrichosporon cavernicola]
MRAHLVVTYWLALAGIQASAVPFRGDHGLEKRQSDTGVQPSQPAVTPQPSTPAPPAPNPSPSPAAGGGDSTPAPASQPAPEPSATPSSPPAPAPNTTPLPSPAPSQNEIPAGSAASSAPPADQSVQQPPPPGTSPTPSVPAPEPTPSPAPPPAETPPSPAPSTSAPVVVLPTQTIPEVLPTSTGVPQDSASSSPNVSEAPLGTSAASQGVAPSPVTHQTRWGRFRRFSSVIQANPSSSGGAQPSGQMSASDGASVPAPPPATSGSATQASDSAAFAPAATQGIGADNTQCTTSNGLKGKVGPGGCFANAGQDCSVSDGIKGVTTDSGTCAPVVSVGASCTLSNGAKGTAQLQGLGTSLSCIGDDLSAGGSCSLPFNVIGTIGSDGRTCVPPKEAPSAGQPCPVPGISGLGVMQPDGKTCLPPTPSDITSSSGGGNGGSLSNGAGCAIGGQAGTVNNGACMALVSKAGDPCYRGGEGAFFSNAIPDGILGADLTTCEIVNDTCNANGVQGRWSPSYVCSSVPPSSGNPAQDGDVCQRSQMWGGRWDAATSTCILPGDPCPTGIYGPNAKDCIPKPAAGSGCQTGQGFNGSFNDAGLCVATIPPGERTPCISVKSIAGTISITPNGTLCQIPPNPDTPQGLLQDILPSSYCSNGKDAGAFNDLIECEVQQRPGGLSAIPEGTPGNPRNDISSLQTVTHRTQKKNWIPGVIAACAVVAAAVIIGVLLWKCGPRCRSRLRRRQGHESPALGPGDGILDETTYGPQPTFPTVNAQYRDYNQAATSSPPTGNRLSDPDPYSNYNQGANRSHNGNRLSMISDTASTTDPFNDSNINGMQAGWNQRHPSEYSAASVSAYSGSQSMPLSPPGSPPIMQMSPPVSPGMHVVNQPLLSGYPADPPAYPAEKHGHNQSPFR